MPVNLRRSLAGTAALLVFATGCTAGTELQSGASPESNAPRAIDSTVSGKLDTAITEAMRAAKVPGALVGIRSPDWEYVKAFGVADTATQSPMNTNFYSRIGSVTKTFTATAVLQLVDDGKIGLDDPITRYLDGVPNGQNITVRQLADMRSGLVDYTKTDAFQAAITTDPRRAFSPQDLLRWSFARPANFAPGQRVEYSNTNYILLGLLVEKVSGQALPDYLSEHILGPLDLSHTSFPDGNQFPEPHARGYTEPPDSTGPPVDATDWTTSFTWAAGAMVSTLGDMHTWLPALATGTLLSPELQEQRLRTNAEPGSPPDFGYGMGIFTVGGWVGHNGSVPGYQTVAMYLPARQMSLVVMINTDIAVPGGGDPSEAVAEAVTSAITPDHVYRL